MRPHPIDQQQRRADPGDVMAEKHPRGGGPSGARLLGKPEHREIGHAQMHRRIAEPREEDDPQKADLLLGSRRRREERPDVSRSKFAKRHQRTGHEHKKHPRGSIVADLCHHAIAFERHERHRRADRNAGENPGDAGRHRRLERRHLDRAGREKGAHRRGRDSDHRAS